MSEINLMIGHSTVKEVKDEEYQSESYAGETTDDAVLMQHFGFKSKPPEDSEALVVCVNGDQDDTTIVAEKHEDSEPEGLEEGESVLYNDHGVKLILLKDGTLEVTAKKIKLNGEGKQFVTHAELDAALQKNILQQIAHTHLSTAPGSPTGVASASVPVTNFSVDISASATTTVLTDG